MRDKLVGEETHNLPPVLFLTDCRGKNMISSKNLYKKRVQNDSRVTITLGASLPP
jgi:hypothetical protein